MTLQVNIRHAWPGFSMDVAFEAPAGVTALFGRSGTGKTSVVRAVAGLFRPDQGVIRNAEETLYDSGADVDIAPERRRMGYVFQDARLFPHLNVQDNLLFGARFAPGGIDRSDMGRVADLLGIDHLLTRQPRALSGGETARVALGRALLTRPRMLLMDEPLAALDEERKQEILPYLERLRDEAALPVLYVSHAMSEIARLADTLVILRNGQVARAGPAAEVLSDPSAVPVLGVREAGAVLQARVENHPNDGITRLSVSGGALQLPGIDAPVGSTVRVRVLAQDVIVALKLPAQISALNVLPATIADVRTGGGPGAAVALQIGADRLLARVTGRSVAELGLAPGLQCFAIIKATTVARSSIGRANAGKNKPF